MSSKVKIRWEGDRSVTGRLSSAGAGSLPPVLLAHGAGAGQNHPLMTNLRDGLAASGVTVLAFNYPYTEEGRKRPDRPEVLMACHRAAAAWLRARVRKDIVLAGRSMGGRIGTQVAAEGEPCSGLVLYAYPLHPLGKPDRLRKDHLAVIRKPMLFFIGSRDPMARPDLVDRWIRPLRDTTVETVSDGDHSFRVRKASGRTEDEVLSQVIDRTVSWLRTI